MRHNLIIAGAALAAVMLVLGCRPAHRADESESQPAAVSGPTLSVTAARVTVKPMSSEIRILGTTAAIRHVTLRAPAAGRVVGFDLQSGESVRRGQVIARIVSREVEAAEAGLEVAGKIDPKEAEQLARSVKRYTKSPGIAVVSPESAIVARPLVSSGQTVAYLDPLADLIDPASVYVDAALPIGSAHLVTPGMDATVTSSLHPGVEFPARVAALSPSFDPNTLTATARLTFTGKSRPNVIGAPVDIRITTRHVPEAIAIPVAALFQDAAGGGYYVFVAGSDGRAHRTTVGVGIRNPSEVQITRGLSPGEIVITSGGYALSDGLTVRAMVSQQ
jgi:multidrug efflux pump subunit AcrA (membrane-fusion protein)